MINRNIPVYIGEELHGGEDDSTLYYCVNCNNEVEYEYQEICKQCGQVLSWEKGNDIV